MQTQIEEKTWNEKNQSFENIFEKFSNTLVSQCWLNKVPWVCNFIFSVPNDAQSFWGYDDLEQG